MCQHDCQKVCSLLWITGKTHILADGYDYETSPADYSHEEDSYILSYKVSEMIWTR